MKSPWFKLLKFVVNANILHTKGEVGKKADNPYSTAV